MAIPFVDGFRLLVERGMTGATGNFYCGLHEAEDMAFALHFLRPGDVFYDIGANVGSYTILAPAAGVTEVQSFEPAALAYQSLRRNVAMNGMDACVALHRCALGGQKGTVQFTTGLDTTNHVLAGSESPEAAQSVAMERFDTFYVPGRPSFLKIDVEGYESEVLSGASVALDDPSLMGVLVEDNGSNRRYGIDSSTCQLLESHGFRSFQYNPHTRELRAPAGGSRSYGNVLFLRNHAEAIERTKGARRFRLVNGWI